MRAEITHLNKTNFNDATTLISAIMKDNGIRYKRAEAVAYLSSHDDKTMILEINDVTMGMYAYSEHPNSYTLNFFALNPYARKSKLGYKMYLDMKGRLKGKPVIVPVHSENKDMINIVKKRGIFIGRFNTVSNKTIDYFSIDFGNKEWK